MRFLSNYYKSVNRGLTLTKPGLYAIAFVLGMGVLGMLSQVNGAYLMMSFGMGLLIVSGILSERMVRDLSISEQDSVVVTEGFPHIELVLRNRSSTPTYLVEVAGSIQGFERRVLGLTSKSDLLGRARIVQGEASVFLKSLRRLDVGIYQSNELVIATEQPFGLLQKYKYVEGGFRVAVVPQLDQELYHRLQAEHSRRDDEEFYYHKPFQSDRDARYVDWKRSAGLERSRWAVKTFQSDREAEMVVIGLRRAIDETTNLTELRKELHTVCKFFDDINLPVSLMISNQAVTNYTEQCFCLVTEDIEAIDVIDGASEESSLPLGYVEVRVA